jgi:hypothetical protein
MKHEKNCSPFVLSLNKGEVPLTLGKQQAVIMVILSWVVHTEHVVFIWLAWDCMC